MKFTNNSENDENFKPVVLEVGWRI